MKIAMVMMLVLLVACGGGAKCCYNARMARNANPSQYSSAKGVGVLTSVANSTPAAMHTGGRCFV